MTNQTVKEPKKRSHWDPEALEKNLNIIKQVRKITKERMEAEKTPFLSVIIRTQGKRFEALKDAEIPAILNVSEESRRMEDMMRMYRMTGGEGEDFSFPTDSTLIVNTASPLIAKVEALLAGEREKATSLATYLYRLTVLSQRRLDAKEMQTFLKESYRILAELAQ